ncbi:conjugal transfer protein TraG, partial [bacterium]|nr:conjugal transfer protein TraG [bacterium]
VTFAVNNPSSTLSVDELRRTPASLATSLAKAKSSSIFTKYFSEADKLGASATCTEAWDVISADMTPEKLSGNIESTCTELGYNVADAAQLNQCRKAINDAQSWVGLGALTLDEFMKQQFVKERLDSAYQSGNTQQVSNYQFLTNVSGSMKSFNEFYPVLRGVLTAVSLALIPILVIFLPTPMAGKIASIIFGFFIWLTAWGVVDAILHGFAMEYADSVYEKVRNEGLGLDALYFFPDSTVKALGMFGTLRLSGLMLATALTGMLVKFGGHAVAQMAGGLQSQVSSAGSTASSQTEHAVGQGQALTSLTQAAPAVAWAGKHSFDMRSAAVGATMEAPTSAFSKLASDFGVQGATELYSNAALSKTLKGGAEGQSFVNAGLGNALSANVFGSDVDLASKKTLAEIVGGYKGGINEYAQTKFAQDRAIRDVFGTADNFQIFTTMNMLGSRGDLTGEMNAFSAARSLGGPSDYMQFRALRSEMKGITDWSNASAIGAVASRYGMTSAQLSQMNSLFQTGKHAGEVAQARVATGRDAMETGIIIGSATGAAQGSQAMVAAKEMGAYMQAHRDQTWGMLARDAQMRSLATTAMPANMKSDPAYFSDGKITDVGFFEFAKRVEGAGIRYQEGQGTATATLSADGSVVKSDTDRVYSPAEAMVVANEMQKFGNPNVATRIKGLAKDGHSIHGTVVRGADGRAVDFNFTHGGTASDRDLSTSGKGRVDSYSDITNVEKGLRKFDGTDIFTGMKKVSADREERDHFAGNIGGVEFKDAKITRNGNNFVAEGHAIGGGWMKVEGQVFKGADGNTRYLPESVTDNQGVHFSPQAAAASVLNQHRVPEAAMGSQQAKSEFANAFVGEMRRLRGESAVYTRDVSGGGQIRGGVGGGVQIPERDIPISAPPKGPVPLNHNDMYGKTASLTQPSPQSSSEGIKLSGGGHAGASINIGSTYRAVASGDINLQYREAMKILDRHQNTAVGRAAAAQELLRMYQGNAENSGNRLLDFKSGGAYKPK